MILILERFFIKNFPTLNAPTGLSINYKKKKGFNFIIQFRFILFVYTCNVG